MTTKINKMKRSEMPGGYSQSDNDVIIERWEIQEQKLKTSHLGLAAFLNKHFQIKGTQ